MGGPTPALIKVLSACFWWLQVLNFGLASTAAARDLQPYDLATRVRSPAAALQKWAEDIHATSEQAMWPKPASSSESPLPSVGAAPASSALPSLAQPSASPAMLAQALGQPLISLDVFAELAAAMANFFCTGIFIQNRTKANIWANEGCIFGCAAHLLFNLEFPAFGLGRLDFGTSSVTATLGPAVFTYAYLGPRFGCQLQAAKNTTTPTYVDDGRPPSKFEWIDAKSGSPNAIPDLDYAALEHVISAWYQNQTAQSVLHTRAMLVVHQGKIVAERYDKAQEWGENVPGASFSLAKSLTSAMVGMRIADGAINLTRVLRAPSWSPQEAASRNITVKNLLQMEAGMSYSEQRDALNMVFAQPDPVAFAASFSQAFRPGTAFNYSTANYALLQYMLRQTFEKDTEYWSYPINRLFKRIGAKSMLMEVDSTGTFHGGVWAIGTARDFARFGLLYLQGGKWEGQQLVPRDWVEFSITPTTLYPNYAAGFWRTSYRVPKDTFFMAGFLGQRVLIIPSQELVFVHLGFGYRPEEIQDAKYLTIVDELYFSKLYGDISAVFSKPGSS